MESASAWSCTHFLGPIAQHFRPGGTAKVEFQSSWRSPRAPQRAIFCSYDKMKIFISFYRIRSSPRLLVRHVFYRLKLVFLTLYFHYLKSTFSHLAKFCDEGGKGTGEVTGGYLQSSLAVLSFPFWAHDQRPICFLSGSTWKVCVKKIQKIWKMKLR